MSLPTTVDQVLLASALAPQPTSPERHLQLIQTILAASYLTGGSGGGGGGVITGPLGAQLAAAGVSVSLATDQLSTLNQQSTQLTINTTLGSILLDLTNGTLIAKILDGGDATQGAKADTATTGTGITTAPFSAIALLKGIYNSCVASIPAGTALIGSVKAIFGSTTGTINVTTSGTAGTYTAFASTAATSLTVVNTTGTPVAITAQIGGTGTGITIPANGFYTFTSISNTNQIGISLVTTGSAVTVTAVYEN